MAAKKKEDETAPAAITPAVPVFAADAGAAFQKDRSGDARSRELTEGQANFASFSATIQAMATVEAE